MLHRILNCFGFNNDNDLSGEIEVDETYVGAVNPRISTTQSAIKGTQGRSSNHKALDCALKTNHL